MSRFMIFKPLQLLSILNDRHRSELSLIHSRVTCSRSDLHEALGIRKNTITDDVSSLIDWGLVMPHDTLRGSRGRPRVTLSIRPDAVNVVGLAIEPGRVLCGRVNLLGEPASDPTRITVFDPSQMVQTASDAMHSAIDDGTAAVGISIPGYIDIKKRRALTRSAWPGRTNVSLDGLMEASGPVPLIIDNTTTVVALRWLLERADTTEGNHLVVYLADGMIGASLLVDGRPVRGPYVAANELGHNRLPIKTPRCYCGHSGCIERIFSTDYLRMTQPTLPQLAHVLQNGNNTDAVKHVTDYLVLTLSNAINMCCSTHVTLMTNMTGIENYLDDVIRQTRMLVLPELAQAMVMERWIDAEPGAIRSAGAAARMAFFNGHAPPIRA